MQVGRAFILDSWGFDGLHLRDMPTPIVGPRQILVKLKAAALNFRDLKILKGVYARNPTLPVVPLSDGSGDVIKVGSSVSRFTTGDRVLPIYMEGWHAGPKTAFRERWKAKGGDVDGTAREYIVCNDDDVVPIPESMSFADAACVACAGVTAWHALVYTGHVKAGDTVLIMGSGGVSLFGLQIALMSGAKVIATSSSDEKLQRLSRMGAAAVINYRLRPDWGNVARELTGGRGVDHVLEVGGAGTLPQSLRATRDGGHIETVGNLSGHFATDETERGIRVTPITVGSREMTEDILRAMHMHRLKPIIDRRFSFTGLKDALAYLETGRHFGKIIIDF